MEGMNRVTTSCTGKAKALRRTVSCPVLASLLLVQSDVLSVQSVAARLAFPRPTAFVALPTPEVSLEPHSMISFCTTCKRRSLRSSTTPFGRIEANRRRRRPSSLSSEDSKQEHSSEPRLAQGFPPVKVQVAGDDQGKAGNIAATSAPLDRTAEEPDRRREGNVFAESSSSSVDLEAVSDLEKEVATFNFAPAMTVNKFKTMQDRRVPMVIKYSGGGGFKRYFEEIATLLKKHFPDVLIEREIVEVSSTRGDQTFEVWIDGKLVCAKRRGKAGVFLRMETFEQAVRKARQRRRPGAVVYGDQETYQNVKALTKKAQDDISVNSFEDTS